MFSTILLTPKVYADCSKHKKSCIGAGCEMSNAKYKQCIVAEKNNIKSVANTSGKRIIVKGAVSSTLQEGAFNGMYFDFKYRYEMQLWTLLGEAVVTCNVIWEPKNQNYYTFKDTTDLRLAVNIPISELSSSPKISDMELLIPIHKIKGNFTTTNYVKCDAGAMGAAGKKSFTTPGSPAWNKIIVTNSRKLSSQSNFIDLTYSYLPAGDAKALVKSMLKSSGGVVIDNGAQILKAEFNTRAYKEWLNKKKKTEKEKEEEDDFWSGEEDEPENEGTDSNESSNDDDFWAGETAETSTPKVSDEDFWAGETTNSSKDSDFWDGDESNDSTNFEIKTEGNKQGVVSKSGKVLIPFRNWQILSYKSGFAQVQTNSPEKGKSGECSFIYKGSNGFLYGNKSSQSYTISFMKKGLVDNSGDWLIKPEVFVDIRLGSLGASAFSNLNKYKNCSKTIDLEAKSELERLKSIGYKLTEQARYSYSLMR